MLLRVRARMSAAAEPLRLADDRLEGALAHRLQLMAQKVLSLPGDDGQGVIDLVPGARGELRQSGQLQGLQPFPFPGTLLFQGLLQGIQIALQTLDQLRGYL